MALLHDFKDQFIINNVRKQHRPHRIFISFRWRAVWRYLASCLTCNKHYISGKYYFSFWYLCWLQTSSVGTSRSPKLELIFPSPLLMGCFSCFLSFPRIMMNCVPPTLERMCLQGWICASLTWEFLIHLRIFSRVPCPGDELNHILALGTVVCAKSKVPALKKLAIC